MAVVGLLLLAYVAIAVTANTLLGWRRERYLAQQVALLASLKQGQSKLGESLAEVEIAAMIHTTSKPGGAEETQSRRALRASQTNEE